MDDIINNRTELISLLTHWNPWWSLGNVPDDKKRQIRAEHLNPIMRLMPAKEVVVLTGVRRCGKSTLIYQAIDSLLANVKPTNIFYFNLDEPLPQKSIETLEKIYRSFLELNNPAGRKYIFLDEIQAIPGWEQWVKKYYDMYGEDVKFVITGSNSTMMSANISKLLTGRTLPYSVFPLSFSEFLDFRGVRVKSQALQKEEILYHFAEYLFGGGFPEAVLEKNQDTNQRRLREYFDSVLMRDVVASRGVRESAKISELAHYAATNIAASLSYNKISNAVGLSINSLREYLNYMEDAYLIFQLRFFSYSVRESIMVRKPRKMYCIDNGMRNAASFRFSKEEGKLAENLVFIELKRRGEEIYFWSERGEVDFVIKNKDGSLTAMNVTYTDEPDPRETKSIEEMKKEVRGVKDAVILTRDLEKDDGGIRFVPLWKWAMG